MRISAPLLTLMILSCVSAAIAQESRKEAAIAASMETEISVEDRKILNRVENYLSGIKSLKARFSQVSPDGGVSQGNFYLQRPGKLRMEYEPPVPVLVVANNNSMIYYDRELDQVTNVPLDDTLVGFIAKDKVKFDRNVTITYFESEKKSIRVALVQTSKPKDGMMTLEFSDQPLALRNIVITDSGDQSTVVSLADAKQNDPLDPSLFIFKDPSAGKGRHIRK